MRALLSVFITGAVASACSPSSGDGGPGPGSEPDGSAGGDDAGVSLSDAAGPSPDADPASYVNYAEAHFAGTHNSFKGGTNGDRGSLTEQLAAGVRNIELDIHAGDFSTHGYRVGHHSPGDDVAHGGGNPDTDALVDWLEVIADWSAENPRHAPITLVIDLKDPLNEKRRYEDGDLARLNDVVRDAFGDSLYAAEELGGRFPSVGELRGRVLVVMSGSESARLAYRRDPGHNIAVAVNDQGHVIEVHDSGNDDLWYWTGEIEDGYVRWHRHTKYDTGERPAVALNNQGHVVEVHQTGDDRLFYRVGELGDDFEIDWYHDSGIRLEGDDGVNPTVRFVDRDGLAVREIHESETSGDHFFWDGEIDVSDGSVSWTRPGGNGETDEPLHDKTADATAGYSVAVSTGSYQQYGSDTLRYHLGDGAWRPIRYEQVLFVEAQHGGSSALQGDDVWFFAAPASSSSGREWAEQRRIGGGVVRLWSFNDPGHDTDPPVNFPATDYPREGYYGAHCAEVGCLDFESLD